MEQRRSIAVLSGICLGTVLILMLAGGSLFYWILPLYARDPMEILSVQTPVRIFTGESGEILHVRRTWEGQWRFAVPLEKVAPMAVRMILAVEDRNFYQHSGLDFRAILRACRQNLTSGKIVSGASTISMQLSSMTLSGPRRSWKRKIIQILRCRKLEMLHSKKEILQEYLNRIPMGGNLYGMESAARFYFGRSASELNLSECALLCGLPQRPNAWRPDRHLKKALRRRDLVLHILERQKILTAPEVKAIKEQENLRFRSFAWKADFMELEKSPDRMYFDQAAKEASPECFLVKCAYRRELSGAVREVLRRTLRDLPGVTSASAILIENATGRIVTLIGSVEDPRQKGSQINGAFTLRSGGSTLKPFLYAEAVSGGMVVEDTLLQDLPVRYGNYVPVNYDGKYRGLVSVQEALADSLNIPAVELTFLLGEERVMELFRKLHLIPSGEKGRSLKYPGLSLALGSAGHTLFDLGSAYRVFSRDGVWSRTTFLVSGTEEVAGKCRVFVSGTCAVINDILSRRPLPDCTVKGIFWKTGTSNGNRDAWCFAWSPRWTLGVWFGNKDHKAAGTLIGVEAAAPAAGRIFSFLHTPGEERPGVEKYVPADLCRESGLRASAFCKERFPSRMLKEAPLRKCDCTGKKLVPVIRTPVPGKYFTGEKEKTLTLTFACTVPDQAVHWMLNGVYLGRFSSRNLSLERGVYSVQVIGEGSTRSGGKVDFTVE